MRCFVHFDLHMCFGHSRVQFFDIGTSKIAPKLRCFVHFDLQMCFAPERRGIFRNRSFKNGSGDVVFCAFWLENVLRAAASCDFSFLCWTATSAPAALASLRTSGTTNHRKNTAIRDFIWRVRICVLLTRPACWSSVKWLYSHVELLSSDFTRVLILCRRTLLFNCPYCRKLVF